MGIFFKITEPVFLQKSVSPCNYHHLGRTNVTVSPRMFNLNSALLFASRLALCFIYLFNYLKKRLFSNICRNKGIQRLHLFYRKNKLGSVYKNQIAFLALNKYNIPPLLPRSFNLFLNCSLKFTCLPISFKRFANIFTSTNPASSNKFLSDFSE